MNNDFEKNINGENVNSDNQDVKKKTAEHISADEEVTEVFSEEQTQMLTQTETQQDTDSPEEITDEAENTAESEENCEADEAETFTHPAEEHTVSAVPVNTAYNPHSGTYSYSKQDPENAAESINGCMWDKTTSGKNKAQRKTVSSKGFKAFVAVMLGVFTISAASIAGFMAADYMQDRLSAAVNNKESEKINGTYAGNYENLVSKFADSTEGLTKSQVAAKCAPSAVGIVVEIESSSGGYMDFGFFGNYYSAPQIVQGAGSGFIYNSNGYIITNHHVVDGAKKITVYLSDKTPREAELIGSDSLSDIAVIKINPEGLNLVPMEIGNSDMLVVGDEVIAIGCPAGIEYMGTVTDGIISAINRDVELSGDGTSVKKTMTLLQTNATINKGNSGGPLINAKGQVIGINTLKLGSNYEGIGFSIPMNGALPIINQLIEHGKVIERTESFVSSEGVIGIQASPITESEAEYYDIPVGVLVVQIDKDSSAAKAGLRRGDIITAYEGTAVKSVEELNRLKASDKAGDEVTITVYRDSDENGENKTFDITFKLDMAK